MAKPLIWGYTKYILINIFPYSQLSTFFTDQCSRFYVLSFKANASKMLLWGFIDLVKLWASLVVPLRILSCL